jgi:hypothetical protein
MKAIVDDKPVQRFHLILVVSSITLFASAGVARALPEVEDFVGQLQQIVDDNPGTPLADKAEDALAKAQTALDELAKTPPDCQAALGNMEGAVGDLKAAVNDELLDAEQGTKLMNLLTCAAWQLAAGAIFQAIDCEADADKIAEAEEALDVGEELWLAGAYKDAVAMYKDALAIAEGAISGSIDPLAGVVTQDLASEDGQLLGKALLCYDENTNETCIRLKSWGLEANAEYTVVLFESDQDGNVTGYIRIGSFTTNVNGNAYLQGRVVGDLTDWCVVVGVVDGTMLYPTSYGVEVSSDTALEELQKFEADMGIISPELWP